MRPPPTLQSGRNASVPYISLYLLPHRERRKDRNVKFWNYLCFSQLLQRGLWLS